MKTTEFNLSNLRLLGMWPAKGEELTRRKKFHSIFLVSAIFASFTFVGNALHLFFITLREPDRIRIIGDLLWFFGQIGGIYYVIAFVQFQKKVALVIEELKDFSKFGKPRCYQKCTKRLNFAVKLLTGLTGCCLFMLVAWNLITISYCHKLNEKRSLKDICGLLIPTYWPFEIDYFPLKQLAILWQIYCVTWIFAGPSVISLLMLENLECLICRIEHLKELMKEVVEEKENICKWVQYHQDIYSLGKNINDSYAGCLSLHVIISGIVFGIIAYSFTVQITFNAAALFSGWFCNLSVACFSGQRLMEASSSIGIAVFHTKWYNSTLNTQKTISLILQRSQERLLILNAWPIADVNLVMILGILRTSYSYLNVMNAHHQ